MEVVKALLDWVVTFHQQLVIAVCAALGSVKASLEFDMDKPICVRSVDVLVGLVCGVSISAHYASSLSLGLQSLLAVVAGACGSLSVEVILQVLPSLLKQFLTKYFNK